MSKSNKLVKRPSKPVVYETHHSKPSRWGYQQQKYTADEVIDAIVQSRGIVSVVAQRLGCTRQTVYNYMERYAKVRQAVDDEREDLIDNVENALIEDAMTPGNFVPKFYLLNNLGRKRGWANQHTQIVRHEKEPEEQSISWGDHTVKF